VNSYKFGVLREQMHVFHETKKMNEKHSKTFPAQFFTDLQTYYNTRHSNLLYLSVLLQYSIVATVSTLRFTLYAAAGGVAT